MQLASLELWSTVEVHHNEASEGGSELDNSSQSDSADLDVDYGVDAVASAMAPAPPYRRSISKERFPNLYSALKTQTYNDPAARGPGSA